MCYSVDAGDVLYTRKFIFFCETLNENVDSSKIMTKLTEGNETIIELFICFIFIVFFVICYVIDHFKLMKEKDVALIHL